MFQDSFTMRTNWVFRLIPILFLATVSACGQADEVALSEQVPPRRGSVDTLAEVQEITTEILSVSETDVIEEADFREDLGADDEEMARLAEAFAEAFGIELSETEISALTTVRSAVDLIESK